MNSNTQKVEGKTENIGEIFTLNFQAKNLVEFAHSHICESAHFKDIYHQYFSALQPHNP